MTLDGGSNMRVEPLGEFVGADIDGIDLSRPLREEEVDFLRYAVSRYGVVRLRGQQLTDRQLMAMSGQFGALDVSPGYAGSGGAAGGEDDEVAKFVAVISNVVENGKPIGGLGDGEAVWHADMTYIASPPAMCALYALEVPPSGGRTGFLSLYHAFDTLPPALRERAARLQLKHDATYNSAGEVRRGVVVSDDPRHTPGWVHPLVATHPRSGRKLLLLGRRRNASIVGLPLDESEELLDRLWEHTARDDASWHQTWEVGDVIMWDNVATMHRRDSFPSDTRRVMHRTQILGSALA
ncbi:MAG: TauD/TfdA family dioxygenase [Alcaligenaceae bacterium]|nr:TauD/TfdA family dioxygenase [Alcaligenaceae bacterium SAGV5]MPS52736.1 TauD/TfdA family dioxygenase [Alcaligenaceae bacterium SAGV3]MPT60010.1 TauD/TfdA family dioxygenase [Alcaligenaceae bacterium]